MFNINGYHNCLISIQDSLKEIEIFLNDSGSHNQKMMAYKLRHHLEDRKSLLQAFISHYQELCLIKARHKPSIRKKILSDAGFFLIKSSYAITSSNFSSSTNKIADFANRIGSHLIEKYHDDEIQINQFHFDSHEEFIDKKIFKNIIHLKDYIEFDFQTNEYRINEDMWEYDISSAPEMKKITEKELGNLKFIINRLSEMHISISANYAYYGIETQIQHAA